MLRELRKELAVSAKNSVFRLKMMFTVSVI